MEEQTLKHFAALVKTYSLDGFTLSGKGTMDGNGLCYWKSFWLRREWHPSTTNIEEMRPRPAYISNSKNVQLSGVKLINSLSDPFFKTPCLGKKEKDFSKALG